MQMPIKQIKLKTDIRNCILKIFSLLSICRDSNLSQELMLNALMAKKSWHAFVGRTVAIPK